MVAGECAIALPATRRQGGADFLEPRFSGRCTVDVQNDRGLCNEAGIFIGVAAAYGPARLMAAMLFAVKPTSTIVFTVVAALPGVVALLAIYGPARRAVRIDPAAALRYK